MSMNMLITWFIFGAAICVGMDIWDNNKIINDHYEMCDNKGQFFEFVFIVDTSCLLDYNECNKQKEIIAKLLLKIKKDNIDNKVAYITYGATKDTVVRHVGLDDKLNDDVEKYYDYIMHSNPNGCTDFGDIDLHYEGTDIISGIELAEYEFSKYGKLPCPKQQKIISINNCKNTNLCMDFGGDCNNWLCDMDIINGDHFQYPFISINIAGKKEISDGDMVVDNVYFNCLDDGYMCFIEDMYNSENVDKTLKKCTSSICKPVGYDDSWPTKKPTKKPTQNHWETSKPTKWETKKPTKWTNKPTKWNTHKPTPSPTKWETMKPTKKPTIKWETQKPTKKPTKWTNKPTQSPTKWETQKPTNWPTNKPTKKPTYKPTYKPSMKPTYKPSMKPSNWPTYKPTKKPTMKPTFKPTYKPTYKPSMKPSEWPTYKPTFKPTNKPTKKPTYKPTPSPTKWETEKPTKKPTKWETEKPTKNPTKWETMKPTKKPTNWETAKPTKKPTKWETEKPTKKPTNWETEKPTKKPIKWETEKPTKWNTQKTTEEPNAWW